jgi:hypothetical protein
MSEPGKTIAESPLHHNCADVSCKLRFSIRQRQVF